MIEHSIFYYPYASFTDMQASLLKLVALSFDKLYILNPEKASGGIVKDVAIPGTELILDWCDGKKTVQENGLHYLLGSAIVKND